MSLRLPISCASISFGCHFCTRICSARIRTFVLGKSARSCSWVINGSQNLFTWQSLLFTFFHPLQKRHLHFLARTSSDNFVFGLHFLQSLLIHRLNFLLTLKSLHGDRPIHPFPLLSNLINLLESSLTCALVEASFLCRHILRALCRQSFSAGGIWKTNSNLVMLLSCISSTE